MEVSSLTPFLPPSSRLHFCFQWFGVSSRLRDKRPARKPGSRKLRREFPAPWPDPLSETGNPCWVHVGPQVRPCNLDSVEETVSQVALFGQLSAERIGDLHSRTLSFSPVPRKSASRLVYDTERVSRRRRFRAVKFRHSVNLIEVNLIETV